MSSVDGHCPIVFCVLICSCMSFLCLIVSIIIMWFFNKTLFILSSIILSGGGAVRASLVAGWTGQSVASSRAMDGVVGWCPIPSLGED